MYNDSSISSWSLVNAYNIISSIGGLPVQVFPSAPIMLNITELVLHGPMRTMAEVSLTWR